MRAQEDVPLDEESPLLSSSPPPPSTSSSSTQQQHYQHHPERRVRRLISWDNYVQHLEKRPLLVKSITATFILGGADLCGQGVEHLQGTASVTGVDWFRVARFAAFGLFGTPWSHYYFHWLDQYLPTSMMGRPGEPERPTCTVTTWVKVFIDQFIQAPLLLAIMICALALMKGLGFRGAFQDMKDNFVVALIANWKLWLPASAINMIFVKPSFRVLYINVVFFVWTIILSLMLNSSRSNTE